MSFWSWVWKGAVFLWNERDEIQRVAGDVERQIVSPEPKGTPLPHQAVDQIEAQIASATSHKVEKGKP